MQLIGESTRLTFAALCIGDNFTMGIDDAIRAAEFVRCNEILGLHYNTFPPIRQDGKAWADRVCKDLRVEVPFLQPGEAANV